MSFFLESNTSCASILGSEFNDICQLYAHLEIVPRSFVKSLALSPLFIITEKREVSSANNLTLDLRPSGKKVPKWILEELRQEQAASLNTDHLEELFEIYRSNNA